MNVYKSDGAFAVAWSLADNTINKLSKKFLSAHLKMTMRLIRKHFEYQHNDEYICNFTKVVFPTVANLGLWISLRQFIGLIPIISFRC